MKITAAPGIYLAVPIKEKTSVALGTKPDRKLLKAKIISVGEDRDHDSGGKLTSCYKEGDIIYFMSYAENYDWFEEDNQKIYAIIFNDVRAKVEE